MFNQRGPSSPRLSGILQKLDQVFLFGGLDTSPHGIFDDATREYVRAVHDLAAVDEEGLTQIIEKYESENLKIIRPGKWRERYENSEERRKHMRDDFVELCVEAHKDFYDACLAESQSFDDLSNMAGPSGTATTTAIEDCRREDITPEIPQWPTRRPNTMKTHDSGVDLTSRPLTPSSKRTSAYNISTSSCISPTVAAAESRSLKRQRPEAEGSKAVSDQPATKRTSPDRSPIKLFKDLVKEVTEEVPDASRERQIEYSIGYDPTLQEVIDQRIGTAFGIQYELARHLLEKNLSQNDVDFSPFTNDKNLKNLTVDALLKGETPNVKAAEWLANLLEAKGNKKEANAIRSRKEEWLELDREEKALREGEGRGLGVFEDPSGSKGVDSWYGGTVHFTGKVKFTSLGDSTVVHDTRKIKEELTITLSAPKLGKSCLFARKFGSRSFLRLRVDREAQYGKHRERLFAFAQKPFVFVGRVWRAVLYRNETLILLATNEMPRGRNPRQATMEQMFLPKELYSIRSFVNWFAPPEDNAESKVVKWVARFHLGFSDTVPVLEFKDDQIVRNVPDIIGCETGGDEAIMTDGCGAMSWSAMRTITLRLGLGPSSAVQGRIAGSKGLWIPLLEPAGTDEPWIELRNSQMKVNLPPTLDRAHRILNVNTIGKATCPASITSQVIQVLWEQGVPSSLFLAYCDEGLKEVVKDFFDWDPNITQEVKSRLTWAPRLGESEEDQARRLRRAIEATGVLSGRHRRELGAEAKAKGYISKDRAPEDDEDDDPEDHFYPGYNNQCAQPDRASAAIMKDPNSGQPNSLHETALALIDAGFLPQNNEYLAGKINCIINDVVSQLAKKFRLTVPLSASALVIPDPVGVLEEDEVYFSSTSLPVDQYGYRPHCLQGDVLVFRYPCYLTTDVRKVKAVDRPELRKWQDVVIFSTKGRRSLASVLGGGDYDGDRVQVLFDPRLTEAFRNEDEANTKPPPDFMQQFDCNNERLSSVLDLEEVKGHESEVRNDKRDGQLQERLIHSLRVKTLFGKYSNLHYAWSFYHGAGDPDSILLAHKVAQLLDAAKTGVILNREALAKDSRYKIQMPESWWFVQESSAGEVYDEEDKAERDQGFKKFDRTSMGKHQHIFDQLMSRGEKGGTSITEQLKIMKENVPKHSDPALKARWTDLETLAETDSDIKHDMGEITKAGLEAWNTHSKNMNLSPSKPIVQRRQGKVDTKGTGVQTRAQKRAQKPDQNKRSIKTAARIAADFALLPPLDSFRSNLFRQYNKTEIARVKASYAYTLAHNRRFPWDVGFSHLLMAKAEASGGAKYHIVNESIYAMLKTDKRFIKSTDLPGFD